MRDLVVQVRPHPLVARLQQNRAAVFQFFGAQQAGTIHIQNVPARELGVRIAVDVAVLFDAIGVSESQTQVRTQQLQQFGLRPDVEGAFAPCRAGGPGR